MKNFPKAMFWAGALILSIAAYSAVPALAQQKTVKACEDEWKAHKADNQKNGITEKDYVAKCRSESSTEKPKATPTVTKSKEPADKKMAAPAKKTVKECRAEWTAHKADNQKKGITEKAYVDECRAGAAATKTEAPKTTSKQTAAPTTGKPTGANQYATEGTAKIHCLTGVVVWANLGTKVYHFSGNKDYGHTKKGAYMCEKDATAQGLRAAKNEKHP